MARRSLACLLALEALFACGPEEPAFEPSSLEPEGSPPPLEQRNGGPSPADDAGPPADAGSDDAAAPDDGGTPEELPPGFIGSACNRDEDCAYEGGVCITDGAPGGVCSMACDRYCPDEEGHPVTFCVDSAELEGEAASLGDGACLSRCDLGRFPGSGCREGYGCVVASRANEPETERYACLPGAESELGDCHLELSALGVSFEPTVMADESPPTHPELVCHVEDPVLIRPPIHGVDLVYYDGTPTPTIRGSCEMAKALVQTVDDVASHGVTCIRHIGTYNCRVIAGTDILSRHGYGDAIDIYGFDFDDGTTYTLIDHWEHDTDGPQTSGGIFLYEAAHRWYDQYIWSIILTPNYNAAHDNHFHVDLTPGSHYIGWFDGRYIGPAPFVD